MDNLTKSIDALIDELIVEPVNKSMIKDQKPAKETADEAVAAAPKGEKDEARGAGRPKQIADVPQTDTDGSRAGEYDSKIAAPNADTAKKEDSQVEAPAQMKKALSDDESAELASFRADKLAKSQAETLEKARKETSDLIKSAVTEAVSAVKTENADLRKALVETQELVKAMANKPQKSKAVTNVQHVEKFQKSNAGQSLSKAEILDVGESLLAKSKQDRDGTFTMEHMIELENTGNIFDPQAKAALEREVKRVYRS